MFATQSFSGSQGSQTITMGGLGAGSPEPKKARQEEKITCLPVSVRTVQEASKRPGDGDGRFFGTEPSMLLLVGVVESVSRQAASVEFAFNDSTGRIHARYYTSEAASELADIEAGRYVSVAAQLRTSPVVHLAVTAVRLVKAADEISYHVIEAAHSALKLQRPSTAPRDDDMMTPSPKKHSAGAVSPSKESTVAALFTAPSVAAAPVAPIAKGALEGPALRGAVLLLLQREGEGVAEGLPLATICGHLASTATAQVAAVLQQLVSEGDVFNTIDDDHFSVI